MTKTAIRKIPSELPHANIYLDDLFEIEDILSREYANLSKPRVVSFEYEIDDKICITSQDELIQYGGSSKKFSLNVIGVSSTPDKVLIIDGSSPPRVYVNAFDETQRWNIFLRVESIFKARSNKLKNTISPIFLIHGSISFPIIFVVGIILAHYVSTPHSPISNYIIELIYCVCLITFTVAIFSSNRIHIEVFREGEKERRAVWNKRIEQIISLIIGTVIGVIATQAVNRFKH